MQGWDVINLNNVGIDYGPGPLLREVSVTIERGERWGLIGRNGTGKTTLLNIMAGRVHAPARGAIRIGSSVELAYYRQDLAQVPEQQSLFDIIHDLRPLSNRGQVQAHLGRFGFSGDTVQRDGTTLPGGERARVALAMLVLARANLLLLDEPTNHLDVESIEALEDALLDYDGTVLTLRACCRRRS